MPGLDTLRGIAVFAVVCYHGMYWALPSHGSLTLSAHLLMVSSSGGWLGVNLFFILSGFLITGILVDTKSRSNYWKSFYVRRALRILPLYLIVLVLAWLYVGIHPAYMLLCLFYAANFAAYFSSIGPGYGVLWSLAVEEQFYLVWPLVIRRNSARILATICVLLMVVCPILRGFAGIYPKLGDPYTATWLISDNLAWGALLALFLRSSRATLKNIRIMATSLALSGTMLLILLSRFHLLSRKVPLGAALQVVPFLMLFSVLLLLALRYGDASIALRWSAPLRFLGYISYGLYLLHMLFFLGYDAVFTRFRIYPALLTAPIIMLRFITVLVFCSFVCYLSRRYFEARFLLLKDRLVPYSPGEQPRLRVQPGEPPYSPAD